jgi:hypothetical protein
MRTTGFALIAVLALAPTVFAQSVSTQANDSVTARGDAVAKRGKAIEAETLDPSLRSLIGTPQFELSAEIAEGRKKASAKAGFRVWTGLTGEVGVTGAFDEDSERSVISSLRELSQGSSAWFGLSYKRYRVKLDWKAMERICREAAWAGGQSLLADCEGQDLPTQSFAERRAEILARPPRGVCQRMVRALKTGTDAVRAADLEEPCDSLDVETLERQYGAQFTESFASRHAAAIKAGNAAGALALCNEFRRADGLPPTADCDPISLEGDDKKNFGLSWKQRLATANDADLSELCDEYSRALGQTPTGTPDCRARESEVFEHSFRERYEQTFHWLATPIASVRTDVSRARFEFKDALLNDQAPVTETSHKTALSVGVLTANDVLLAVNYARGKQWKGQDPVEVCEPLQDTAALKCQPDMIIGAPEPKNVHQIELQVKGYIGPNLGAQLLVTHDYEKEAWGYEVPLYFIKDKADGLAGGVVLSYRTDTKSFLASVFIGQVFSMFR